MKLQIDTQKLQQNIQGLCNDLIESSETSEIPVYEYQDEFGEPCQLKLVATKDKDLLISGGEHFHCLSLKKD